MVIVCEISVIGSAVLGSGSLILIADSSICLICLVPMGETPFSLQLFFRVPLKISEIYYQHSTNLTTGMLWSSKTTHREKRGCRPVC